jgi:predicted extracellular nuclease
MRQPRRRQTWITGLAAAVGAAVLLPVTAGAQTTAADVFINEIHYDNTGADSGELVEVAAPAGTDLSGWSLVLYNGSGGAPYSTIALTGSVADAGQGVGFVAVDTVGLQNGSPDGVALIDPADTVVDFLSYEGTLTAVGGPADGMTSTDIGVSEASSTPVGASLQLTGAGTTAPDFSWTGPIAATPGAVNTGQSFDGPAGPSAPVLNELSVSTTGTDVEYYEVAGTPGADYSAYSILEIQGVAEGSDTPGQVVDVTPVGSTDGAGLHLIDLPANTVENDPVTLLLVEGFTGEVGLDLDPGDDGAFDTTPWTSLADAVSIQYGAGVPYASTVLDASFDDATYAGTSADLAPGGASRLPDPTGGWVRNDFDLAGVADPGTPEEGEALNTPGAANEAVAPGVEPPGDLVAVHEVQGTGPEIAISGAVTIQAVVTSLFEDADALDGFFVQEEDVDADTDPATSEGIFVFCRGVCPDVAVGDLVTVAGSATEHYGMSQIDATGGSITIDSSGGPLPTPTPVDLPAPGPTDEDATFEAVEGMIVTFTDTLVVSEYYELARFGHLVLTAEERPEQFTSANPPSADGYRAFLDDLSTRRIYLDDADNDQNDPIEGPLDNEPYPWPVGGLATSNTFRGGDTIDGLTGVLHWSYAGYSGTDAWRVRQIPGEDYTLTGTNTRPTGPPDVGGEITVASFNVLNYFVTLDEPGSTCGPSALECRGADSADELDRQRAKIVAALAALDADVLGLIEIENDSGAATEDLVAALNAVVGSESYAAVGTGTIGGDAIKVALVYQPGSVTPIGEPAILDSSIDPRFIDDKNRPALIQTFEATGSGERFTVAVNHLKSKGSACDDINDPDVGDGQGNCSRTRTEAAAALIDHLATDPTGSGDEDRLIIGDLNAYAEEDPITTITDSGYTDLVRAHGGDGAYSYVYDGQVGYLDHALANGTLAGQVTGTAVWHINADEVGLLDYNDSVADPTESSYERESSALPLFAPDPYRSSDHDPVVIGLDLGAGGNGEPVLACGDVSGTAGELAAAGYRVIRGDDGPDLLLGTDDRDFILAGGGPDLVVARGGADVVCGGPGPDLLFGGSGDDQLHGGSGDDLLVGDRGRDLCDGGSHWLFDLAASCETRNGIP